MLRKHMNLPGEDLILLSELSNFPGEAKMAQEHI